MAVSGANLHNVFMLLTLEPQLARNPYLVLHVRRNHLVSDTLRELTSYSDVDLKKPLKVSEAWSPSTGRWLFSERSPRSFTSPARVFLGSGDLWRRGSRGRRRSHKRILPAAVKGAHGSGLWDVHLSQRVQPVVVLRQSKTVFKVLFSATPAEHEH